MDDLTRARRNAEQIDPGDEPIPYVPGEFSLAAHRDPYPEREWCPVCGWRKGGKDSWDGISCKCGYKVTR